MKSKIILTAAFLAISTPSFAGQGQGPPSGSAGEQNSARDFAPGREEKQLGESPKDYAPGQQKKESGESAPYYAPGQEKKWTEPENQRGRSNDR